MGKNVQVRLAKMAAVQRVEKEAMEFPMESRRGEHGDFGRNFVPKKSSKHLEL